MEAATRAAEMLEFLEKSQLTPDLEWVKGRDFLRYFEAARSLIVRDMLLSAGIGREEAFEALDFGYLHGLVPEFLHRDFPGARITVFDLPSSPIFANQAYLSVIG